MSDDLIEQPVIPLPEGFTWGFVTARFIHAMADTTWDFDRYPEARGSNGRVIFTPRVRFNKHTEDPTAFVQYEVARARIREGTLIDADGEEGIWLITGEYDVTFQIDDGSIPGFPITVTEEYTKENPLDLVKYSPIETPPGYTEIVRIIDRERAEEAAQDAEGYAQDAEGYAQDALQFSQTETFDGYISSAEDARDLANQYQLSASESATTSGANATLAEEARDATEDLVADLPDSFEGLATEEYVDTTVDNIPLATNTTPGLMSTEDKTQIRTPLPDGVDLDTVTEPGMYILYAEPVNGPDAGDAAYYTPVEFDVHVQDNMVVQEFHVTSGISLLSHSYRAIVDGQANSWNVTKSPTVLSSPESIMRRSSDGKSSVEDPTQGSHIANKRYVDNLFNSTQSISRTSTFSEDDHVTMTSPNGTRYQLAVTDDGKVVANEL